MVVSCQWLHLNGRTKGWTLRISWNSSRDLTVYSRVPGSPKHQWLEILWFSASWNFLTDFCWVVNAQQLLIRNGRKENSWTIQYVCSSRTSKKPKPFAQTQKKEPGKRWSTKIGPNLPQNSSRRLSGNSNSSYVYPDSWSFMIQFWFWAYFFKWLRWKTTNYVGQVTDLRVQPSGTFHRVFRLQKKILHKSQDRRKEADRLLKDELLGSAREVDHITQFRRGLKMYPVMRIPVIKGAMCLSQSNLDRLLRGEWTNPKKGGPRKPSY